MDKKIKNYIIFLTALFIFLLTGEDAFSVGQEFQAMKALQQSEDGPETVISRPRMEYKAEGLRDPFEGALKEPAPVKEEQLPQPVSQTPPPLSVQGIIWGGNFPLAIINNKVVKVGDTLEGAEILNISKEGVTIKFTGNTFNLMSPSAASMPNNKPGGENAGKL